MPKVFIIIRLNINRRNKYTIGSSVTRQNVHITVVDHAAHGRNHGFLLNIGNDLALIVIVRKNLHRKKLTDNQRCNDHKD